MAVVLVSLVGWGLPALTLVSLAFILTSQLVPTDIVRDGKGGVRGPTPREIEPSTSGSLGLCRGLLPHLHITNPKP